MARSKATSAETRKQVYEEKLFRETTRLSWWDKFTGTGVDKICQEKTDLEKEKGDTINFGLLKDIPDSQEGVTGNATMKGNEVAIETPGNSIVLDRFRQAVKSDGKLEEQKASFDLNDAMSTLLKDWGRRKIDRMKFNAAGIGSSPVSDPTLIMYHDASGNLAFTSAAATAKAAMHATNSVLTIPFFVQMAAAVSTGLGRRYNPLRPVNVGGRDYWVFITHPDALVDLKQSADYKNAMLYAAERGKENPIFTGANAIIENIVIHEHEYVGVATDGGGASVAYSRGALFGAQALLWAWGARASIVEEADDYEEFMGKCWRITAQVKRAAFESKDYGMMGVWCARTNISGATVS